MRIEVHGEPSEIAALARCMAGRPYGKGDDIRESERRIVEKVRNYSAEAAETVLDVLKSGIDKWREEPAECVVSDGVILANRTRATPCSDGVDRS